MNIERSRQGTTADLPDVKEVVILDNNAYRDLTLGVLPERVDVVVQQLRIADHAASIHALLHPIVAMELAARLPNDTGKKAARSALTAAGIHTTVHPGEIAIVEDPEQMIAQRFFGTTLEDNRDAIEKLSTLTAWSRSNRTSDLHPQLKAIVDQLDKHVVDSESRYLGDMFTYVVKPLNPALTSWRQVSSRPDLAPSVIPYLRSSEARRDFARMRLTAIGTRCGRCSPWSPSESELDAFSSIYHIGVALYLDILQRVLVDVANLTKKRRENWF